MKRLIIIISLIFLFGCGPSGPTQDEQMKASAYCLNAGFPNFRWAKTSAGFKFFCQRMVNNSDEIIPVP